MSCSVSLFIIFWVRGGCPALQSLVKAQSAQQVVVHKHLLCKICVGIVCEHLTALINMANIFAKWKIINESLYNMHATSLLFCPHHAKKNTNLNSNFFSSPTWHSEGKTICNSYNTGARDVWHILHRSPRGCAPEGWVQYMPCIPRARVITCLYPVSSSNDAS